LLEERFSNLADSWDRETFLLLRNEIFARHGHSFEMDIYRDYFSKQPWYTERLGHRATAADLSPAERAMLVKLADWDHRQIRSIFGKREKEEPPASIAETKRRALVRAQFIKDSETPPEEFEASPGFILEAERRVQDMVRTFPEFVEALSPKPKGMEPEYYWKGDIYEHTHTLGVCEPVADQSADVSVNLDWDSSKGRIARISAKAPKGESKLADCVKSIVGKWQFGAPSVHYALVFRFAPISVSRPNDPRVLERKAKVAGSAIVKAPQPEITKGLVRMPSNGARIPASWRQFRFGSSTHDVIGVLQRDTKASWEWVSSGFQGGEVLIVDPATSEVRQLNRRTSREIEVVRVEHLEGVGFVTLTFAHKELSAIRGRALVGIEDFLEAGNKAYQSRATPAPGTRPHAWYWRGAGVVVVAWEAEGKKYQLTDFVVVPEGVLGQLMAIEADQPRQERLWREAELDQRRKATKF
jgi:hypothetical protein